MPFLATYGMTYGMHRTTIYLPDELKRALTRIARREGRSEAELIREAVQEAVERRRAAAPRIPLFDRGLGDPDLARRVDEVLDGFGS